MKGDILRFQGRTEEAVAEHERALALDPSNVDAAADLGFDYVNLGEFDKSLEYFDKAILAEPVRSGARHWYGGKAWANFGLKRYDQAIELARQAIAINPNYVQYIHATLVAALALTGHDAEAREALQRYLALPSTGPLKTIAALKAYYSAQGGGPRPRRGERADLRRPAQGGDAGGVKADAISGERRPRCAEGLRFGRRSLFRARNEWQLWHGPPALPEATPVGALRPITAYTVAIGYVRFTSIETSSETSQMRK